MLINQADVRFLIEEFEMVMLKLERALDSNLEQSAILRTALDKTGSELAEQLIWDAQKKLLENKKA